MREDQRKEGFCKMKKRVGILTSGGDCPGLNATIRGVAKAQYARMGDKVEIVGILNGFHGLITGDYKEMNEDDFRGILTLGGTILGTKRTPFKLMRVVEEDKIDKVAAMKKTYKDAKLDCLRCLGGNGTHKTANLLSQEGLNIIGLPKTIDTDIYGTDVTYGFPTAVDVAPGENDRRHPEPLEVHRDHGQQCWLADPLLRHRGRRGYHPAARNAL